MISETTGYNSGKDFAFEVLQTLQQHDIPSQEEQILALYLYVPNKKIAEHCCEQIRARELECEISESAVEDGTWLCYATTPRLVLNVSELENIGSFFIQLAKENHADFDGWELGQENALAEEMDLEPVAQNILDSIRANFSISHQFRKAKISDFEQLDPQFYQAVEQQLTVLGYKSLSDFENVTISEQGIQTLIRSFFHPELHHTVVAYYVPALELGITEFETFLSDNSVVLTTTNDPGFEISNWPKIKSNYCSLDTPLEQLHTVHDANVRDALSQLATVTTLEINHHDAFIAEQNKMCAHKHQQLQNMGWVTKEYLTYQTGGDEVLAEGIYLAIQKLLTDSTS